VKDFGFVATVFLPQRRSPGIVGRKLNGNGIVLRAKYFLPGVGICTKIICNLEGREIVEKHLGQRLTWAIQHPDNVEMSAPPSNPANKSLQGWPYCGGYISPTIYKRADEPFKFVRAPNKKL